MSSKEFLNKIRHIDMMIDCKLEQISELRSMLLPSAIRYDEDKVQTSPSSDSIVDTLAKVVELEEKINADIDELVTLKSVARDKIERMENDVSDSVSEDVELSVSIGVAIAPEDGTDYVSLCSKADKALYHVKQNGKNNYHFFRVRKDVSNIERRSVENHTVDMEKLQQVVSERNRVEGAYRVEYDGFKHIYQFVSRSMGRTGQDVQMALFTLNYIKNRGISPEILNDAMKELERAIVVSLRQGDVTTQYSSFQYVVLLMNASPENGERIAQRICHTWQELNEYEGIQIDYSVKDIPAKND